MPSLQPLLNVFVLWHPEETAGCRAMAEDLFTLLSWNSARPFAREIGIPTYFRCQQDAGAAAQPFGIDLDAAQHSVVLALVDDSAVLDTPWVEALAALQRQVDGSGKRHHLVVIAVESAGLQLPPAITGRLAIRLFAEKPKRRARKLGLHAAAVISRVMEGSAAGAPSGAKLFISHTKRDSRSLDLARAVKKRLQREDNPVRKFFFDAIDIEASDEIEGAITASIGASTLLVVRTDGYAASPWCQLEVLLAKQHQRPIVVLDALDQREDRALPFLGNVPCIRVDAGAAVDKKTLKARINDVVEATVVETMRFLYAGRKLTHLRDAGRLPKDARLVARPPEERDLRGIAATAGAAPTVVVYPDPSLALCEVKDLHGPHVTLTTPLTNGPLDLTGRTIALSISDPGEGLAALGLSERHLFAAMDLIARALLSRGATLAYGGDLRAGGFTEFLGELVRAHNGAGRRDYNRIRNFLPWPRHLAVSKATCAAVAQSLEVVRAPPPADLVAAGLIDPATAPGAVAPRDRYALARALLAMRETMTGALDARVVLGGKLAGFSGRLPGIVEEALLALDAGKPVYVLGGFGGAAATLADLLSGATPPGFTHAAIAARDPGYAGMTAFLDAEVSARSLPETLRIDYAAIAERLQRLGVAGLNNGLSEADNRALMRVQDIDEAVWLILKGLAVRYPPRAIE